MGVMGQRQAERWQYETVGTCFSGIPGIPAAWDQPQALPDKREALFPNSDPCALALGTDCPSILSFLVCKMEITLFPALLVQSTYKRIEHTVSAQQT